MPLFTPKALALQISTSQSNLGGTSGQTAFFNGIGAGYSVNALGATRRVRFLSDGFLYSAGIILQQATASVTATGGTVSFVNHTKGVTTTLASGLSTISDGDFYETVASNLNALISSSDQYYLSVSGFNVQPTNLRIIANLYFYVQ